MHGRPGMSGWRNKILSSSNQKADKFPEISVSTSPSSITQTTIEDETTYDNRLSTLAKRDETSQDSNNDCVSSGEDMKEGGERTDALLAATQENKIRKVETATAKPASGSSTEQRALKHLTRLQVFAGVFLCGSN